MRPVLLAVAPAWPLLLGASDCQCFNSPRVRCELLDQEAKELELFGHVFIIVKLYTLRLQSRTTSLVEGQAGPNRECCMLFIPTKTRPAI